MTGVPTAMTYVEDEEAAMSVGVEALFTSALGLKSPWEVVKVELDTATDGGSISRLPAMPSSCLALHAA